MKFIQIRAMYLLVSLSRKSRSRFHHQSRNPEFPRQLIPSPENRDSGPGFRDFRDSRFPDRVTLVAGELELGGHFEEAGHREKKA